MKRHVRRRPPRLSPNRCFTNVTKFSGHRSHFFSLYKRCLYRRQFFSSPIFHLLIWTHLTPHPSQRMLGLSTSAAENPPPREQPTPANHHRPQPPAPRLCYTLSYASVFCFPCFICPFYPRRTLHYRLPDQRWRVLQRPRVRTKNQSGRIHHASA